jgi:hypothetical protein
MLRKINEGDLVGTVKRTGPFTVDWLRENMLSRGYHVPPDYVLVNLTTLLNRINSAYQNSANQMLAADARYAVWILMQFFDERERACEKADIDPPTVENERKLRDRFASFLQALAAHTYALDMDAGGMMRPYQTWRDFARWVGCAFQSALTVKASNRRKIGFTNEGPIAWLTNETIGVITGKKPGVYLVGQHLKQPYRKKERNR